MTSTITKLFRQERTTVEVQMEDIRNMIGLEVESLTQRIKDGRKTLTSRATYRAQLESENLAVRDQIQTNLHNLRSEENLLHNMEVRLTDLSGRTYSLEYLKDKIQVRSRDNSSFYDR